MAEPIIISLGSINMDFQVRADRWPDPGETLLSSDFLMTGGGKAANVAVLAHKLGANVLLFGHVGDDALADHILRQLDDTGIDPRHVTRRPGTATAVSTIVVRPDGDKTIILAPNANLDWDDKHDAGKVADAIENAPDGSVLVIDLEIPIPVVRRAMEAARGRSMSVVLDPSPADNMPDDLYELATMMTPNESEAEQLTGMNVDTDDAAERGGKELLRRGAGAVCPKRRGGGCTVVSGSATHHIRPVPVDIIDKTGAGDAFAAGMGVALLEGKDVIDAALVAAAASHVAVTAYGSQQSYPDRDALDRMIEQLANANASI